MQNTVRYTRSPALGVFALRTLIGVAFALIAALAATRAPGVEPGRQHTVTAEKSHADIQHKALAFAAPTLTPANAPDAAPDLKAADWTVTMDAPLSEQKTFTFGMNAAATARFDDGLDVETPVAPPFAFGSIYSAIFVDEILDITLSTDIRGNTATAEWFVAAMAPVDQPMPIAWGSDDKSLPTDALLTLTETDAEGNVLPEGTAIVMSETTSLTIPTGSARYFRLRYTADPYVLLDLAAGWNLISLPLQPTDDRPDIVFADINALEPAPAKETPETGSRGRSINGEQIWGWEAGTEAYATAQHVRALQAYWLFADSNMRLVVTGTIPDQTSVTLKRGWNLFGPQTNVSVPTEPTLRGLAWYWHPPAGRYLISDRLMTGKAYWVNAATITRIETGNRR